MGVEMNKLVLCAFVLALAVLIIYIYISMPITWLLVFVSTALLYGSLSPSIASRRLFFLSTASSHMALFAVALGIIMYRVSGLLNEFVWAVALAVVTINVVGYMIRCGVDPDVATSIAVALSASGSVVATYYVLTAYSIQYNLWSIILGDPLLTKLSDAVAISVISVAVSLIAVSMHKHNVYFGIDPDYVKLSTSKIALYDTVFYTALAVASVALLKAVGFILEHILLTLPAIIASNIASSSREALLLSILVSVASSLLGLVASVYLNIAPASGIGFIILGIYIATQILRLFRHG